MGGADAIQRISTRGNVAAAVSTPPRRAAAFSVSRRSRAHPRPRGKAEDHAGGGADAFSAAGAGKHRPDWPSTPRSRRMRTACNGTAGMRARGLIPQVTDRAAEGYPRGPRQGCRDKVKRSAPDRHGPSVAPVAHRRMPCADPAGSRGFLFPPCCRRRARRVAAGGLYAEIKTERAPWCAPEFQKAPMTVATSSALPRDAEGEWRHRQEVLRRAQPSTVEPGS